MISVSYEFYRENNEKMSGIETSKREWLLPADSVRLLKIYAFALICTPSSPKTCPEL